MNDDFFETTSRSMQGKFKGNLGLKLFIFQIILLHH